MAKRISVVVSQGSSNNPSKRALEENLVAALIMERGIDVVVVPNLYDLSSDGTGVLALQGLSGPIVLLSWLFDRAARWTLDRHGVRGKIGVTAIKPPSATDDEDEEDDEQPDEDTSAAEKDAGKLRVWDSRPVPQRSIYCLDLRWYESIEPYVTEIRRIHQESQVELVELMSWIGGTPTPQQLNRYLSPNPAPEALPLGGASTEQGGLEPGLVTHVEDQGERRWYPVIDYTRCTNCMECIDFCLFGVYGVDRSETILVEQPDNCRKGCPACSRVCPENAIIFPQHKTPAIAGAEVALGGLKIDLSRLFGAPDGSEDAATIAARERDEQLMLAGRKVAEAAASRESTLSQSPSPVSMKSSPSSAHASPTANSPTANSPTANSPTANSPTATSPTATSPGFAGVPMTPSTASHKDDLDHLIDALDELDL